MLRSRGIHLPFDAPGRPATTNTGTLKSTFSMPRASLFVPQPIPAVAVDEPVEQGARRPASTSLSEGSARLAIRSQPVPQIDRIDQHIAVRFWNENGARRPNPLSVRCRECDTASAPPRRHGAVSGGRPPSSMARWHRKRDMRGRLDVAKRRDGRRQGTRRPETTGCRRGDVMSFVGVMLELLP